jgi:hypothetical protein
MRKRLRKKKRVGEFQEFGVELEMMLRAGVDFDALLEDFLRDAVDANGLAFGGGGRGNHLAGFLELGRRDTHQSKIAKVTAWLVAEHRIETFVVGDPVDAWSLD